jgi:hypothetical protein
VVGKESDAIPFIDRVPSRGVGALLRGGLDRRVRLRWLAG